MENKTRVITAHVPVALAKQIDAMAAQMERPRGWIIKQALRDWISYEDWKDKETLKALAAVDTGDMVPHAEIEAWVNSLYTPKRKKKK